MPTEATGPAKSVSAGRTANGHVGLWLAACIAALLVTAIAARYALGKSSVPMGQEATGTSPGSQAEQLWRSNRLLRLELNLASTGGPYLLLDLTRRALILKSHGATLREFPIQGTMVRASRLVVHKEALRPVLDTVWMKGVLLPPRKKHRVEILSDTVTPPDPSGTVSYIPPAPEEEFPTLPAFRIRFSGRLSLLVRDGARHIEAGSQKRIEPSITNRLLGWVRMRSWRVDRAHVELVLPSEEAGALYRAFTDGTDLLVVGVGGNAK